VTLREQFANRIAVSNRNRCLGLALPFAISIVASLLCPRAAAEAPGACAVPKEGHAPWH
jgi:hypothetical protein